MSRNRDWMYPRFNKEGMSNAYVQGVEEFVNFAFSQPDFMSDGKIKCPCCKCENRHFKVREDVTFDLYAKGFMDNYKQWVAHGEPILSNQPVVEDLARGMDDESSRGGLSSNMDESEHPYRDMILDGLGQNFGDVNNENDAQEFDFEEEPNAKAQEFYNLLKDADTPLWHGCKNQTKLSFISQMLSTKADYNLSEACYNRMMATVKSGLPEDNCAPKDFYSAKKMLKGLGLGYEKIDACINNCILFYKENSHLDSCNVCGHPRYKPVVGGKKGRKGTPHKVLRYLPITSRLQRLFMSRKTAEHMTWHAKKRTEPEVCHVSDSEAWKHFDLTHEDFASEDGNVRVAICSDGFTPFGQSAKPYSCWPVMVAVYNLPPSMCMTRPFIFLSLIIPGPKSPGKHLDVFLRPLIDELKFLWTEGINTYDAFRKKNFKMRVALMWTISDFPACGMLCGWSTHGRKNTRNSLSQNMVQRWWRRRILMMWSYGLRQLGVKKRAACMDKDP